MSKRQPIQTKRNVTNKRNWEARVAHALRILNKAKYYKLKSMERDR